MSTDTNSKASWMAVVIVILSLIVLVGFFFLWLHPTGPGVQPAAKTASSALQSVTPTGSAVSVPNFVVAPGISQTGTLEGAIQGRCGNIAWQKLDPLELRELRKLCPQQAAAASSLAQGQGKTHE